MDLKAKHQEALDRFRLVENVEQDQRKNENEDLKFDAGDQWSDDAKVARGGSPAEGNQPAVPPRPMIVIRSMDQPIAQVVNQARNARMAVKISPKSDEADQETADVIGGIIRQIEYDSRAQSVYLGVGAYQRAVVCGRGGAAIEKEYASDEPGQWDQVLRIKPVINGFSVYLDPWTEDVNDPAGPRWGFRTKDYPEDVYKDEFGDTALANADTDSILTALGDEKNTWIRADKDGKPIYRVAEYFFVEQGYQTDTHPTEGITRDIPKRTVYWGKINGVEFIDPPQEWDGQFIPLPRVVGVEKNVGGVRSWEGMIRPNIGPCRMLNFGASTAMENMGLSTRGKWIGYTGQFEGIEKWDSANTRNWNYLEANATVSGAPPGTVLPLPTWANATPDIQSSIECISMFTNFIRSTTGVPDAALGHVNPSDRSGSAIKQLQQASEQGTSNFPDNLRRFIEQIGHILLDLIPKIYDRPGRIVHILTGQQDEQKAVMLNQPYIVGKDGSPQPVIGAFGKPVMDPRQASLMTKGQSKFHDLSKGQYSVVVDVGKAFATRRQEAVGAMTDLAAAAPELLPRYADLLVKAMDIPESEAIAERLEPPGSDKGVNPAISQQLQQLQQENQQLKFQQAAGTAKAQIDAQAMLQKAQLDNASREKVAWITALAGLEKNQVTVDAENARTEIDAISQGAAKALGIRVDAIHKVLDQIHDSRSQASDQAHQVQMAQLQHAQTLQQGQQSHQQALEQGDQSNQNALEQAAQSAALAPEPAQPSAS